MAKLTTQASSFYRLSTLRSHLPVLLLLLILLPHRIMGQVQPTLSHSAPFESPTPNAASTLIASPAFTEGLAAASSADSSSNSSPSHTDTANYASQHNPTTQNGRVLNYYFLLLAIFVVFLAFIYWSFARRRYKRLVTSRTGQQSALAQDLQTWPGRRRGAGRWPFATGETRTEEGLDERGEAPPPYLKEPEPVHRGRGGEGMELDDMSRVDGKPPEYNEGPVRR